MSSRRRETTAGDFIAATGKCVHPRDDARLRKWFEDALGTPMLRGDVSFEYPSTNGSDPVPSFEEI